jgi:hypothetical protein
MSEEREPVRFLIARFSARASAPNVTSGFGVFFSSICECRVTSFVLYDLGVPD